MVLPESSVFAGVSSGSDHSKVILFLKIDFKKIILLPLYNRLLTVVTFNVLSLVGASITGCIAGIIGFYIIRKFDEICSLTLSLAYENSDADCKYFKQLISNTE